MPWPILPFGCKVVSCDLDVLFQKSSSSDGSSQDQLGHLHLAAKSPNTLNIFLYENMIVRVEALEYSDSVAMAAAAEALLVAAPAVDPPALAMTTPSMETVAEWDEFSLVVNSPQAGDVDVLDDDSVSSLPIHRLLLTRCLLYPSQRLFQVTKTKEGDNWTFNFVVLGSELWTEAGEPLPDKNGVDNIVIFAYAKDMEMLPSWISIPLTITPAS